MHTEDVFSQIISTVVNVVFLAEMKCYVHFNTYFNPPTH